jgi:hypothetical protein
LALIGDVPEALSEQAVGGLVHDMFGQEHALGEILLLLFFFLLELVAMNNVDICSLLETLEIVKFLVRAYQSIIIQRSQIVVIFAFDFRWINKNELTISNQVCKIWLSI